MIEERPAVRSYGEKIVRAYPSETRKKQMFVALWLDLSPRVQRQAAGLRLTTAECRLHCSHQPVRYSPVDQGLETLVEIHFISSLTEDDEERVALALLGAVEKLLKPFPIAYIVRIETSAGTVLQHNQGAGASLSPSHVSEHI